jgi:hypothetical protein
MATYKEIQDYIKNKHHISVKTCWIAHVKEMKGLNVRKAHNRKSNNVRKYPCPPSKISLIENAMRKLKMF